MRISNKTKDIIFICLVLLAILFGFLLLIIGIAKCFAEETKINEIGKYYAEQTIVNEMQFIKMWEYTENMSETEYAETFLRS